LLKVACLEGLEFAGRMFEVQHLVGGLTEDEIRVMKVNRVKFVKKVCPHASHLV
jgi:hypothetical protein